MSDKQYDCAYFERYYDAPDAVVRFGATLRKARLAVAAAELLLGRDVRSVLDVGAGPGMWRVALKRLRPRVRYVGIDPSEYVVRRWGKRRGIRRGALGGLDRLRVGGPFDLIVCADVLQYVEPGEVRRGLRSIARRLCGVAYLEALTTRDAMHGDYEGWHHRSLAWYRREFARTGLVPCGMHCYVTRRLDPPPNELELVAGA